MRKVCEKMVQRSSLKNKSKGDSKFAKTFWRGKMIFWAVSLQMKKHVSRNQDISAIVYYEFVPTGQTVNQVYYLKVLSRLHEKVRRERPELIANNSWILRHNSAPAHMALSVPEVKEILKGIHFDDIDDFRRDTAAALKAIPQNQFQNCFEGWTRCWHWCIASQGL
jgi:outer membrane protein assembly factor BamD (BamD/ComL family)